MRKILESLLRLLIDVVFAFIGFVIIALGAVAVHLFIRELSEQFTLLPIIIELMHWIEIAIFAIDGIVLLCLIVIAGIKCVQSWRKS